MIVYTVGTFDLLHVGHLALLNHCKSLGDILAVGVASDDVVNQYKPNTPIIPLEQRVEMLEALSCVDIVRPYHTLEYVSGCKAVGADIFVIGEDWGSNSHNLDVSGYLKEMGKEIVQVRYNPRTSSTKIKEMVLEQRNVCAELHWGSLEVAPLLTWFFPTNTQEREIKLLYSKPEAFSAAECDRIIAAITAVPFKNAMLVQKKRNPALRTASLVWLDEVDGLGWVMDRLIEIIRTSNIDQFDFDLREFAESPQVARYDASDNGHFAWHSDVGEGILARKRKLTLVLQLSEPDSYEGGDLEVMPSAQILSANRGQGCVSVFPSFTLHQVAPVQSGVRYSLTLWAHGPVFR